MKRITEVEIIERGVITIPIQQSGQADNGFKDMELICKDCGAGFIFKAGEQQFYAERQLFPPKRCPMDRLKRKEQQNAQR